MIPIVVIKKDGTREPFNRKKVLEGMIRACEKRPVPLQRLEVATEAVEAHLQQSHKKEVESVEIGELVMDELRLIDQVAFVRFASVYREFEDVHKFYDALEKLRDS